MSNNKDKSSQKWRRCLRLPYRRSLSI